MNGRIDQNIAITVVAGFILVFLSFVFTALGYAPHGVGSAAYFLPPAINLASGHGLITLAGGIANQTADPTGKSRFLIYPPLFPLALSVFIHPFLHYSLPEQALFGAGIINALGTLVTLLIFYKIVTIGDKKLNLFSVILICAATLITMRVSMNFAGRPESPARLFIALGLLSMLLYDHRKLILIGSLGVLFGLTAAAHPVGAMFFGSMVGIYFAYKCEWKSAIYYITYSCVIALVSFALIMQFSPFGIIETLRGLSRHSHFVFSALQWRPFISNWAESLYRKIFGGMAVLLLFVLGYLYRRFRDGIKAQLLFLCFAALFGGVALFFIVLSNEIQYLNIISTIFLAVFVYYISRISNKGGIYYGTLAVVILTSIMSLYPIILFPFFLKDGMSIAVARTKFESAASAYPSQRYVIGLDQVWALSEKYDRMYFLGDILNDGSSLSGSILILSQNDLRTLTPPETMHGCSLRNNYFNPKAPQLFHLNLALVVPGYAFAIYECI